MMETLVLKNEGEIHCLSPQKKQGNEVFSFCID